MESQTRAGVRQQPTPEHDALDASNPLRGVVLCCTSIPPEKRTELASQAEQMGAQHKYDLTSEVTHLIVGDYDTPKYRYVAKERPDVKVLRPEWVEEIRRLWIEDQSIDVEALERQYTLPIFASLKLCMTGFDDIVERQRMMDLILENGGDYHGDLTRKVTHLIVHRPEGAKYKHAKNWGIHLISVEWLYDSLERGMILDEKLYHPESAPEERGKGAWIRRTISSSSLGKRSRDGSIASLEEGRRKLRRTASSKLTSQSQNIWGDIVGGKSFAQEDSGNETEQSKGKDESQKLAGASSAQVLGVKPNDLPDNEVARTSGGTFDGCLFFIDGFDKRKAQVLSQHLLSHDGKILENVEAFSPDSSCKHYVVRPHTIALPNPFIYADGISIVTDFWVERCLEAKSCIDPENYCLGVPHPYIPTPGFEGMAVCSTSFEGMQLRHISKAAALIGARYEENFTKDASVLICDPKRTLRAEKLACANSWRIPVVSLEWLTDSIQNGQRQPFKQYLIRQKLPKIEGPVKHDKKDAISRDQGSKNVRTRVKDAPSQSKEQHSKHPKPPKASGFDSTAFDDTPIEIKREDSPLPATAKPSDTPPTATTANEPLTEISSNSQRSSHAKSKSPSPIKELPDFPVHISAPTHAPEPVPAPPSQDLTTAISTLLARSKPTTTTSSISKPHLDQPLDSTRAPTETAAGGDAAEENRRKRSKTRILGRAASNVSATGSFSRASSVDSTASRGQAVIWPGGRKPPTQQKQQQSGSASGSGAQDTLLTATLVGDESGGSEQKLQRVTAEIGASFEQDTETDSAPPQTQSLMYEDVESSEYRALLMARMTGAKVESDGNATTPGGTTNGLKKREKERVATIGSLDLDLQMHMKMQQQGLGAGLGLAQGRVTRGGRVLRDRGSTGGGLR